MLTHLGCRNAAGRVRCSGELGRGRPTTKLILALLRVGQNLATARRIGWNESFLIADRTPFAPSVDIDGIKNSRKDHKKSKKYSDANLCAAVLTHRSAIATSGANDVFHNSSRLQLHSRSLDNGTLWALNATSDR